MSDKNLEAKLAALMAEVERLRQVNEKYEQENAKAETESRQKAEVGKVRSAYANAVKDAAVAFAKNQGFIENDDEIRRTLQLAGYKIELLDTPKKRIIRRK